MIGEVLTATVTPFDSDGNVDYDRYRELCRFLVDHGSDGVVVNGTTGEASTLSDEERVGLLEAALDAIGDRATVVAGTGTNSTAHSIHLTEQAHGAGAQRSRHAELDGAAALLEVVRMSKKAVKS